MQPPKHDQLDVGDGRDRCRVDRDPARGLGHYRLRERVGRSGGAEDRRDRKRRLDGARDVGWWLHAPSARRVWLCEGTDGDRRAP